ncbi:radical SAM protein [Candidatus Woesearchaeota archaeon]|nr:radical SAM protein [Candidatus Woesearchaeota archaeon]
MSSYKCNQNCLFCSVEYQKRKMQRSTFDIKKDVLEAKKEGIKNIGFSGGEPTLRKDIFELSRFAKKEGFKLIRLQTNGILLAYDNYCNKLVDSGINYFKISIHSHIPEIHDYLTQTKGSFKQTNKAIQNLIELNQPVELNYVISKHNYKFIPQFVEYFSNKGISKFCFIYQIYCGNAYDNKRIISVKISEITPFLKEALNIIDDYDLDKGIVFNIPFCLLPKYHERCVQIFNTKVSTPEKIMQNVDLDGKEDKIKFDRCKNCKYEKKCYGVWKTYVKLFGEKEFNPIK